MDATKKEQARAIVQFLETVRNKPGMYIGRAPLDVHQFLIGFYAACRLHGMLPERGKYKRQTISEQVLEEWGYEWTAFSVAHQLHAQSAEPARIIDATLAVEIEIWKRVYRLDEDEGAGQQGDEAA